MVFNHYLYVNVQKPVYDDFDVPPPPPGQPLKAHKAPRRLDKVSFKEKKLITELASSAKVGRKVFWSTGDFPESAFNNKVFTALHLTNGFETKDPSLWGFLSADEHAARGLPLADDALPVHQRAYTAALSLQKIQEANNSLWQDIIEVSRTEATRRRKEITLEFNKALSKAAEPSGSHASADHGDSTPVSEASVSASKRRRDDRIADVSVFHVTDRILEKKTYFPLKDSKIFRHNLVFVEREIKKEYVLAFLQGISSRLRLYLDTHNLSYNPRSSVPSLLSHLNGLFRRYVAIRESHCLLQAHRDTVAASAKLRESKPSVKVSAAGHQVLTHAIKSALRDKEIAARAATKELQKSSAFSKSRRVSADRTLLSRFPSSESSAPSRSPVTAAKSTKEDIVVLESDTAGTSGSPDSSSDDEEPPPKLLRLNRDILLLLIQYFIFLYWRVL
ncbi:hypothetical protein BC829DRAFT_414331 [Chytridium lagenaria]|nr:hypothetical protein BC829DRAFT_414331 [Chytridium lagenaria]